MKILSEFYDFWKERKEKTTLDHKYQIFQICVRRKNGGGSNRIRDMVKYFDFICYNHIPREFNVEADYLSKQALVSRKEASCIIIGTTTEWGRKIISTSIS
jgi:hypothetical protein